MACTNERLPGHSRREFLKVFGCVGSVFLCRPKQLLANGSEDAPFTGSIDFQFRTVDIRHLMEIKSVLEKLDRERRLSRQKIIQGYLKDLEYQAPKQMPNARSVIVVSTPAPLRSVGFRWKGTTHTLLVPGGYFYYENEAFRGPLRRLVAARVTGDAKANLVFANPPLKTLAVRSGLAEYGKNNITYVDGYGSFHILWAFFCEAELSDQWTRPYRTMRICEGCSVCTRNCPTQAIRDSDFVLDAGRCITAYNEVKEPLPDWIDAKAHNSLIGCLKCQYDCPANYVPRQKCEPVAELNEAETGMLLNGLGDAKLEAGISEKLKSLGDWYAKDMKYLSRNVRLALANSAGMAALQ
jgi:epoxyqueuosine reductase